MNPRQINHLFSVTALNRLARQLLEEQFNNIWVSGEVSNFTRSSNGHYYFLLKDTFSVVRCVMFKTRNINLNWYPQNGELVEAQATLSLYEARGDVQLNITWMQKAGLGALFATFEALKTKLQAQGLFDVARKRPLPKHPRHIGVVTSLESAALRDVLTCLKRRMPSIAVIIYPCPVQGAGAAEQIARAIELANTHAQCEALIVCRGGGSLEDLWAYNDETLAYAIANSNIPVVSGIGHETDFSICDFVADARAATPTAAAELLSPNAEELLHNVRTLQQRIRQAISHTLRHHSQALDYLERRIPSPATLISEHQHQLEQKQLRLDSAFKQRWQQYINAVTHLAQSLHHLNPSQVLARGYSIVQKSDGSIVNHAELIHNNEDVLLTFHSGSAQAKIGDIYA